MTFEVLPERDQRVRLLHANLNPQQVKGCPVTETERSRLLERLDQLRCELENAPAYVGALS